MRLQSEKVTLQGLLQGPLQGPSLGFSLGPFSTAGAFKAVPSPYPGRSRTVEPEPSSFPRAGRWQGDWLRGGPCATYVCVDTGVRADSVVPSPPSWEARAAICNRGACRDTRTGGRPEARVRRWAALYIAVQAVRKLRLTPPGAESKGTR